MRAASERRRGRTGACLIWWALAVATPALAQGTAAKWVWYPESAQHDCIRQSRWFRHSFELPGAARSAQLWLLVDDRQALWVNGEGPLKSVESRGASLRYDLGGLLREGRNVIAVEAYNAVSVAGVIARLVVGLADGRQAVISSDASWRTCRIKPDGWHLPGFDDSEWVQVKVVGDAFAQPWIGIPSFHMPVFYTEEEAAEHERRIEALMAPTKQFADDPPAQATVRYLNGSPALVINGAPRPLVFYRATVDPFDEHGRRLIGEFAAADVHLFSPYARLDKLWPRPGEYDFSSLDAQIRAYLSTDPAGWLVVMIRLIPPGWWMEAHPNELVGYGTSEALDGGDERDRIRRGSLASEAWLRDTGEAWAALIRHVEGQPWGKRVVGYHPAYGISGEWHYFGSWHGHYPDTGPAMTRVFREWLREKYGTEQALRRAWQDPAVSLGTVTVPSLQERKHGQLIAFRDPAREQRAIDYYHCHQQVIGRAIEHFGAIVKGETEGRKIHGVYYGYFFGVRPQTQGGHLWLTSLFESPYVDYFVAPYSYAHRLMGQDGRLRSLAEAFNLGGKVHILEGDIRTFLHPRSEYGRTESLEQSLAAIRREFSTSVIENCGFWWVDFGPESKGGWFDYPEIMEQVAALQAMARRALETPRESAAEIAMVCDLESCYYLSDGEGMRIAHRLIEDVGTEMYHLGAPFDAVLLSQLKDADLSRYRMLVFLNTFAMTDEQVALVRQLRESGRHAMVFLWAPGLCGPGGASADRASQVTGLDLQLLAQWLPGRVEATAAEDPLVAGLPASEVMSIEVEEASAVEGFGDTANWYNPRTDEVMRRQYRLYEFEGRADGLTWEFDTNHNYTDIHCRVRIEEADGIGLDAWLEGEAPWVNLRLVIKDANWAEFVAPEQVIVTGEHYRLDYPFDAFENAPWSREKPGRISFPLNGAKVVLDEVANAGQCRLELRGLRALVGETAARRVRAFGGGSFAPALVASGARGRVLGRIVGTEHAGLLASGSGPSTVVFSATPFVPREVLAGVMREAGVHRYTDDPGDVLRADSRFLALHTASGGRRTIRLPRECAVHDALVGEEIARGREVRLELGPSSTTLLELLPLGAGPQG